MPPKKAAKDAPPSTSWPVVEDEVELPEGFGPVPDPSFNFAVLHVAAEPFNIEDAVLTAEGEGNALPPPLRKIDPCPLILVGFKASSVGSEDALARRVAAVGREELKALAESEAPLAGSLAKALRLKIEKEAEARSRRKVNEARRRAIEASSGGGDSQVTGKGSVDVIGEGADAPNAEQQVDLTLLLLDYPATVEELDEVLAEGALDLSNAWVSVFLAATSVIEELGYDAESPEAEAPPPLRTTSVLEPPPSLGRLYDAIHAAELGTPLANSTICTLSDSHLLIPAQAAEASPEETTAASGAALLDAVMSLAGGEARKRLRFKAWLEGVKQRVEIPSGDKDAMLDTSVYDRLARSVGPERQDVPTLLHCLCEQVAATLSGDRRDGAGILDVDSQNLSRSNVEELRQLEAFLDGAQDHLLLGDLPGMSPPAPTAGGVAAEAAVPAQGSRPPFGHGDGASEDVADADSGVLPYLDRAAAQHVGDRFPGGVPVIDEVRRLLAHLEAPGSRREDFPESAPRSEAERSALQNRFYAFMPVYPIAEVERLRLLRSFEELLEVAQPERTWCLRDRVFHERIPSGLLGQVLLGAARGEYLMDTRYDERTDSLLILLHRRALPGRTAWHAWEGDLLSAASNAESAALNGDRQQAQAAVPEPSFNDWWHLLSGEEGAFGRNKMPPPPRLLAADARSLGYCRVVEKAILPADGSVVLTTSLRRGLSTTFPRPRGGDAPGVFVPPSASDIRTTRVIKDDMSFGITTDEGWSDTAAQLRKEREARDRARAEALAAAKEARAERGEAAAARRAAGLGGDDEGEAQGEASAEDLGPPPEPEPTLATHRVLERLRFGRFWVAFQDGARCSVRIHHERSWYAPGTTMYDEASARPGAIFTYTPVSGFLMQVFSDGTLRQTWPTEVRMQALEQQLASAAGAITPLPGGPSDVEVARTVTPLGVLARELVSGRWEVCHPDGTRAFRNPTLEEVQSRSETAKEGSAEATFLRKLATSLADRLSALEGVDHMPAHAKAAGLPGHWVVTRPDGHVFGRVPVPQAEQEGAGKIGEGEERHEEGEDEGRDSQQVSRLASRLMSLLEGEFVTDLVATAYADATALPIEAATAMAAAAAVVEYDIDLAAVSSSIDPHTGEQVSTFADGVLVIEDFDATSRVSVLADGTRSISAALWDGDVSLGRRVVIERSGLASVECSVVDKAKVPHTRVRIACDDGTSLVILPQRFGVGSAFTPADPSDAVSFFNGGNASVQLRRPDGAFVISRGSGDVELVPASVAADLPEGAEEQVLETPGQLFSGVYVARLDSDKVCLHDSEGNELEFRGDQSVSFKLAELGDQECSSPRCDDALRVYGRPDAAASEPPKAAPPPRLIVVRGHGSGAEGEEVDAEELLPPEAALEALRAAKHDASVELAEGEPMGAPLERCRCHTIYRTVLAEPAKAGMARLPLPPTVGGLSCDDGEIASRTFVQIRQIIEYPPISLKEQRAFLDACTRFDAHEEAHRAEHSDYGAGLRSGIAQVRKDSLSMSGANSNSMSLAPAEGGA